MVLATGSELINDIKRAPDDVLSNAGSINEVYLLGQNGALIQSYSLRITWLFQREYMLDLLNIIDAYYTNVVRDIADLQ
jgi:hypothetical protein